MLALGGFGRAQAQVNGPPATAPIERSEAGPRIAFDGMVFDFGRVRETTVVRHDFLVKNTGRADLEISSVNPSCGCTTAGAWPRTIAPGKEGVIPLQVNTTGFTGEISKRISVISNDPEQPNVSLEIKGSVWKAIDVSPAKAVFNVTEESSSSVTRVVRIVSHLDHPLTLSNPRCTSNAFALELQTVRPGTEYELHITTRPPFSPGFSTAPITVQTTSTEVPEVSLAAQLVVQPSVAAVPERISMPAAGLSAPATPTITVRNNAAEPLEIASASLNVPGGDVRVAVLQPGRLFGVSVTLPAGFDVSAHPGAEVVVKTSSAKYATIRIPILGPPASRIVVRQISGSAATSNPTTTTSASAAAPDASRN